MYLTEQLIVDNHSELVYQQVPKLSTS